jgi:hypothetical membrane protein
MKKKTIQYLSGISGILLPIIFTVGLVLSIREAPWFEWTNNAISDLGIPEHGIPLFNYTLVVVGILLLFFTIGLYHSLQRERPGPVTLGLSSIYFIGVGLYPLPDPIHIEISGLFFIAFPFGFFIIGLSMYRKPNDFLHMMGLAALLIVILSLCSPIIFLFYSGIAIPEMMILIPGFLWCMYYSIHLLEIKKKI